MRRILAIFNAKPAGKIDPTGTLSLQNQASDEAVRRIRMLLKGLEDVLRGNIFLTSNAEFDIRTVRQKISEVKGYISKVQKAGLMEGTVSEEGVVESIWADSYLHNTAMKGVRDAYHSVKRTGASLPIFKWIPNDDIFIEQQLALPMFQDMAFVSREKVYAHLDSIGTVLDNEIRALLVSNIPTSELMNSIRERIGVAEAKARTVVRTEIVRTYNDFKLGMYGTMGVDELVMEVELVTAGDKRVCKRCASRNRQVWPIEESKGILPMHPNCRCTWHPHLSETTK